jgi:hypothetical protein
MKGDLMSLALTYARRMLFIGAGFITGSVVGVFMYEFVTGLKKELALQK